MQGVNFQLPPGGQFSVAVDTHSLPGRQPTFSLSAEGLGDLLTDLTGRRSGVSGGYATVKMGQVLARPSDPRLRRSAGISIWWS